MLLRYMRAREVEAFKEADMSMFEDVKAQLKLPDEVTNVIPLPVASANFPGSGYKLKPALFDEIHRQFYENLEDVAGKRYRILVDVPLIDFVRSENASERQVLKQHKVSFVLTPRHKLEVVCGITLKGAGLEAQHHSRTLSQVFNDVSRPLIEFPMLNTISSDEIREKLQEATTEPGKSCPRCGKDMSKRKATQGKNAGKRFWVCPDFPGCNSVLRTSRF